MPVVGDEDEEPPFKTLTAEQEQALRERIERQRKQKEQAEKK